MDSTPEITDTTEQEPDEQTEKPVEKPKCDHVWPPKYVASPEALHRIVGNLNFERIRRDMMLFDIRWINNEMQSYVPDESDIATFALSLLIQTVAIGRLKGVCENRDRGFYATYALLANGNEYVGISYVLTHASITD